MNMSDFEMNHQELRIFQQRVEEAMGNFGEKIKKYSRDSYWKANSVDPDNAKIVKIRDMDDTHLVNVIDWVKNRLHVYSRELLNVLLEEVKIRRLPQEFVEMAPLPRELWGKSANEIMHMKKRPITSREIIDRRLAAIEGE